MSARKKKVPKANPIALIGCAVAIGAFLYAVASDVPSQVAFRVGSSLAAAEVSISAAVPPNPDNTLAAQLQQKEQELDQREQVVKQMERDAASHPVDSLGLYALIASVVLFLLIGINFFLDMRRRAGKENVLTKTFLVDLTPAKR